MCSFQKLLCENYLSTWSSEITLNISNNVKIFFVVQLHDGKTFKVFTAEQYNNRVHLVVLKNWCLLEKFNSSSSIWNDVH